MADTENILISLDARHAENIYAGSKKVELRRRPISVNIGDVVWIYEKIPVGSITGSAHVAAVHLASPATLWRRFGAVSGLSQTEFFDYFVGLETVCALELADACRLRKPLSLATLRSVVNNFQPPQFFLRLQTKQPILKVLQTANHNKKQLFRAQNQVNSFAAA